MDRHVTRLYTLALSILVLVFAWTAIASHPWVTPSAKADPQLAALQTREAALRRQTVVVRRVTAKRWATYRVNLRARQGQISLAKRRQAVAATAPQVRYVNLPAVTVTRTS